MTPEKYNKELLGRLKKQRDLCSRCAKKPITTLLCNGMRLRLEKKEGQLVPCYEACSKLVATQYKTSFEKRCKASGIPQAVLSTYDADKVQDYGLQTGKLDYSLSSLVAVQHWLISLIEANKSCRLLVGPVLTFSWETDYFSLVNDPEVLVFVKFSYISDIKVKEQIVTALIGRVLSGRQTILLDTKFEGKVQPDYEYLDLLESIDEVKL